jgi:hypothetical protein
MTTTSRFDGVARARASRVLPLTGVFTACTREVPLRGGHGEAHDALTVSIELVSDGSSAVRLSSESATGERRELLSVRTPLLRFADVVHLLEWYPGLTGRACVLILDDVVEIQHVRMVDLDDSPSRDEDDTRPTDADERTSVFTPTLELLRRAPRASCAARA